MSDREQGQELEQLVRATTVGMPSDARARVRERIVAQSRGLARGPARLHSAFMRAAAVFVSAGLVTGSVAYAATFALPGDALYGLKRAVEEARVALTVGEATRDEHLLGITQERAEELTRLIEQRAPAGSVDAAAEEFGDAARRALEGEGKPAEEKVRTIEKAVDSQPAPVQERAREQLPDSDPPAPSQPKSSAPGSSQEPPATGSGDAPKSGQGPDDSGGTRQDGGRSEGAP